MTEDDLIAQFIQFNPRHPGPAEARLTRFNVPIWALIGYLRTPGADNLRVAEDYDAPVSAVEAVQAHYRYNRGVIDARIAANNAEAREAVDVAP